MSAATGAAAAPLFGIASRPMLIATDVLEAALAGVLQTLQRQSADIAELRALVAESVPRAEAMATQGALQDRVSALERRVAELESATMVSIPGDACVSDELPGKRSAAHGHPSALHPPSDPRVPSRSAPS